MIHSWTGMLYMFPAQHTPQYAQNQLTMTTRRRLFHDKQQDLLPSCTTHSYTKYQCNVGGGEHRWGGGVKGEGGVGEGAGVHKPQLGWNGVHGSGWKV